MQAFIDGDILPYEMGALKDKDTGEVLPFEQCWRAVQNKIEHIVEAVNADVYTVFLSSQKVPTWRYDYATIQPYKGNREGSEKPVYWGKIRNMLEKTYPCHVAEGIEADDAMSIRQYEDYYKSLTVYDKYPHVYDDVHELCDTIICSRDKDLLMVPGWHYGWECGKQKEQLPWFQSEVNGLRCFYQQLLTGDSVDNILGLFRVGAKSTLVTKLSKLVSESDMYEHVLQQYKDRFGNYAEQFLLENARLLWMQRTESDRWEPPTVIQKTMQESMDSDQASS